MGALGNEAQKFCMLLAKLAGGAIGKKITYIYQRLSVLLQGIRSNQIQTTLARWSSDRGRDGARGGGAGRRENSESG
jgi:hypothetical protein